MYQINCFLPLSNQDDVDIQPMNDEELQNFIIYVNTIIEDKGQQKQFQNDLKRHIGSDSNYEHRTSILLSLNILYRALIEKKIHHGLVFSIVDQAQRCTIGLDSALKMYIIENLRFPQNFEDLLAIIRQNFIQNFAMKISSDVHIQNQILIMGAEMYYTQQSNAADLYSQRLTNQNEMQQKLRQAFNDFYVVFQIIHELEKIIFETLQNSGYQHEGANDESITTLINQLFIKIFSQHPIVQNLVESEKNWKAHHPQKKVFDFLNEAHIRAANLEAITIMLSQIDSPEFHTQLSADQQSTIHEILASFRKSPQRCHKEIKNFLQNEQLYLGSHEMIWENLNTPTQRATFQTWLQHLEPSIARELNALFLNARQIQDKLMKNYHEQQLTFHHYFWKTSQEYTHASSINEPMIHQENIRIAIWKTLLAKNYIHPNTIDPFLSKIDKVILLSIEDKLTFFQGTLHFHFFSKENLYLFEFLGLSKDADSLDVLHHFLEKYWYCHLFNKSKPEQLAYNTMRTYQMLTYTPPLALLEKFMDIPNELKINHIFIFKAFLKIIINPEHILSFIKSWPVPNTTEAQIHLLKKIHHPLICMEIIKHWNVTPKNVDSLYSIAPLIPQEYRLAFILTYDTSLIMSRDYDIPLFLNQLNDSDKSNFIQYLIKKTTNQHFLKFVGKRIIPLFKSEEHLNQCLPYIYMAVEKESSEKFLIALESFKVLFAKTTDETEFKQIILNIPSLFFLKTQYLSTIAKELRLEQKIWFFSKLLETFPEIKNLPKSKQNYHLSQLLKAVESQDIILILLKKHHHLILDIDLYENIFLTYAQIKHQHELIMAFYQGAPVITYELLLQTFNIISQEEYFRLLNDIFKLKGYILKNYQEKIFAKLFHPSMSQNELAEFFLDHQDAIQDHSFLVWLMDYFSPSQNTNLLKQGHPYLYALCQNSNHLFQLFIRAETNTLFNEYLLQFNVDSLIDVILLPRNESQSNAKNQFKTQVYILEFLLHQGNFLKILQKVASNPSEIQKILPLLNPKIELSYLFNEATLPFFKNCAWLYTVLLMHFSNAKHILQQHFQEHLSYQDLALMLSSLKYIKGYIITTQHFYFLLSAIENSALLSFLYEYPIALQEFSNIFIHFNNEFFPFLDVEERINIFKLMIQNTNHQSMSNIFEHLLEKLPKPAAKILCLKHINTTTELFKSLKVFELALDSLDIDLHHIEPHNERVESLLLTQNNDVLPPLFKIFAKKLSLIQQAQYWLNSCMLLSQKLTHHFQMTNSKNFFWQFHEHLPMSFKKQTLMYFIQEYPDFFWNSASFHQLFKAENELKRLFFEPLISKIDVSKHPMKFQDFLNLYLEIKSKNKSKNYILYKILFLQTYGLKLLDIFKNEEHWIAILSLDPTHPEIFETLQVYLQSMPMSGPKVIFRISHLSYHQILLFNLSKSLFERCEGRWDLFSEYLKAFQECLKIEQMHEFLNHHQEKIQRLRFFDIYQFQNWCVRNSEYFFQSEIFELLIDAIIEWVNQDNNYLYYFIKFLAKFPDSMTQIQKILLHPKLTSIHTIEQILTLKDFLTPSFIIQNMLAKKNLSKEERINSIILLKSHQNLENCLLESYLIVLYLKIKYARMKHKNDEYLCDIFENPQEFDEDYKLKIIEDIAQKMIHDIIYQSTFIQDYLKLDNLIISRFKEKLRENINAQNHMHFFPNPCYVRVQESIEKNAPLCKQEDLDELKKLPEFRDFFKTSIINTYLTALMEPRLEHMQSNMNI